MTATNAILDQWQIDELETLFAVAVTKDQTSLGVWRPVYDRLYDFLTTIKDAGGPKAALIDDRTLLWLRGALYVNAGEGYFAALIREDTIIQHRLRFFQNPTDARMNFGLVKIWFRSLVSHYAALASKAKGLMPPRYEWRLRAL